MPGLNRMADAALTPLALEDYLAAAADLPSDLADEDQLDRHAHLLARLHANRSFLVDASIAALKEQCREQSEVNGYGGQVMLLHRAPGRFFVRANFWPSADDPMAQASGLDHYAYALPHDHNFDFLTVGYLGPGYRSDWYDYDYEAVSGFPGEAVELRPTESGQLSLGRMLHYRAHRDIHRQLPPESLSVSVNFVPEHPGMLWQDQYVFDLDASLVASIQTMVPAENLLKMAVHFGDGEGLDLAAEFARSHPSERMRWSAWRAMIGATSGQARTGLLEAALSQPSALVSGHARRYCAMQGIA